MRPTLRTASLLALLAVACGPKAKDLAVEPATVALYAKGSTQTVTATPKDAAGMRVEGLPLTFQSSDPKVATVDAAGKVTAVATGDATIRVAAGEKLAKEVPVKVSIPVSLTIAFPSTELEGLGARKPVWAKVLDGKGREVPAAIGWESEVSDIVRIEGTDIVAVAPGKTRVVAFAAGIKAFMDVTVKVPPVARIQLPPALELKVGTPRSLSAVAQDERGHPAPWASLVYLVDNPKILTVDATGSLQPLKAGKARVTVSSEAVQASVDVVVRP